MTKVIIQIPCYNEEGTLALTLSTLPRHLPGVDIVEWLVINDGSVDRTAEVALENGVDHIVNFERNHGLAKAFMAGVEACLKAGADIIVNTDADNQYCADDIPALIEPIMRGKAEIVVGARPIRQIKHFSPIKKFLQRLGSHVVQMASGTDIPDAPSGFRAISRNAAMQLNIFSEYTYTLEMIIQAGQKGMAMTWVAIRTNEQLRPSRLVKSISSYVIKSLLTILRIFITYRPLYFFTIVGSIPFALGILLGVRWLILFFIEDALRTHVPSLILATILIIIGFQLLAFGVVADLMGVNRKMLEDVQLRLRRAYMDQGRDVIVLPRAAQIHAASKNDSVPPFPERPTHQRRLTR